MARALGGRSLFFIHEQSQDGRRAFEKERLTYQQLVKKLRSAGNDSTDIYRIESSALKIDQR